MPEARFLDIPEEDYPLTIELFDSATDELIWQAVVDGPGMILIPGKEQHGRESVYASTTHNNGMVQTVYPDGRSTIKDVDGRTWNWHQEKEHYCLEE